MPRATSRAREPVGIASTTTPVFSPRRMMEPLPKLRSIWATQVSRAFFLSAAGAAASTAGFFDAIFNHPFLVSGYSLA